MQSASEKISIRSLSFFILSFVMNGWQVSYSVPFLPATRNQIPEDRNWNSEGGMGKSEERNLNSECEMWNPENINQLYTLYLLPSTLYFTPYALRPMPQILYRLPRDPQLSSIRFSSISRINTIYLSSIHHNP
jgi:hypothetical protein